MFFTDAMMESAQALIGYLDASPTAVHAVEETAAILEAAGFREVQPGDPWSFNPGDRFYVRYHYTSIIAGRIGDTGSSEHSFNIIGAHTDSPGFRIRAGGIYREGSYSQAGLEIYGGPLLASWADRDLAAAGTVFLKTDRGLDQRSWKGSDPWFRISQAAIHLNRDVNDKGLVLGKHDEINPIFGSLKEHGIDEQELLKVIAEDLDTDPGRIASASLELYDVQKGCFGGFDRDMIYSGRIDNLAMCRAAVSAITSADSQGSNTALAVLYDSEEIGSATLNGGASPILMHTLERISKEGNREQFLQTLTRSRLFSADGAHAYHPNFKSKYDSRSACYLNEGPAIKINANQRYASNAMTIAETEILAEDAGIPVQKYYHRNDIPCGSTIGPMNAAATGIPTVDIGNPMLSMHSVRECCGTRDQWYMESLMRRFLSR